MLYTLMAYTHLWSSMMIADCFWQTGIILKMTEDCWYVFGVGYWKLKYLDMCVGDLVNIYLDWTSVLDKTRH